MTHCPSIFSTFAEVNSLDNELGICTNEPGSIPEIGFGFSKCLVGSEVKNFTKANACSFVLICPVIRESSSALLICITFPLATSKSNNFPVGTILASYSMYNLWRDFKGKATDKSFLPFKDCGVAGLPVVTTGCCGDGFVAVGKVAGTEKLLETKKYVIVPRATISTNIKMVFF